jgi:hypothetical protein
MTRRGVKKHSSKAAALKAATQGLRAAKLAPRTREHASKVAALKAAQEGLPALKPASSRPGKATRPRDQEAVQAYLDALAQALTAGHATLDFIDDDLVLVTVRKLERTGSGEMRLVVLRSEI